MDKELADAFRSILNEIQLLRQELNRPKRIKRAKVVDMDKLAHLRPYDVKEMFI